VRIGQPATVRGSIAAVKGPAYATSVGLLTSACASLQNRVVPGDVFMGAVAGMKEWLRGIFNGKDQIQFNNRKEGGMVCLKSKK
jgi:cell division ATPase FtsA